MKLDAKNDPAIHEFENWVKDKLHGKHNEQTGKCAECGGPSGEGYQQHKATCSFVRLNYNPQPAPAGAGERDEWKIGNLAIHGYKIYNEQGREVVTNIYRKEDAEQIVAEHNQHATLVEQRERLLQLLRPVTSPTACYCAVMRDEKCWHCEARELIATIEGEGEAAR